MKYYKEIFIVLLIIATIAFSVSPVIAQTNGAPATPPGNVSSNGDEPANLSNLNGLIVKVAIVLRIFAYALAVLALIYAGTLYLTAYGNENKPAQAKNIFAAVVIGLMIVMLSQVIIFAILRTVTTSSNVTNNQSAINDTIKAN